MSNPDIECRRVAVSVSVEIFAQRSKTEEGVIFFGKEDTVVTRMQELKLIAVADHEMVSRVYEAVETLGDVISARLESGTSS